MYQFLYDHGHILVLKDGQFFGTYDTKAEAYKDILEEEGLV